MAARVLVAEDDATLRALVRFVLVTAGYEVEEAPDGRVAGNACTSTQRGWWCCWTCTCRR
jgi:DNA-binding response OmpR family regulator